MTVFKNYYGEVLTEKQADLVTAITCILELEAPEFKNKDDAKNWIKKYVDEYSKGWKKYKNDFLGICEAYGFDPVIKKDELEACSDLVEFVKEYRKIVESKGKTLPSYSARFRPPAQNASRSRHVLNYWHRMLQMPVFSDILTSEDSGARLNVDYFTTADSFIQHALPAGVLSKAKLKESLSPTLLSGDMNDELASYSMLVVVGNIYNDREGKQKGLPFMTIPARLVILNQGGYKISPNPELFPRFNPTVMEPLVVESSSNEKPTILGATKAAEDFIANGGIELGDTWERYWASCNEMFKVVTEAYFSDYRFDTKYKKGCELKAVAIGVELAGSNRALLDLQISLSFEKKLPLLFENITESDGDKRICVTNSLLNPEVFHFTAHIDEYDKADDEKAIRKSFPLDPAQRAALYRFLSLGEGEVLAVNGPPGTGKTAMLRGVIASTVIGSLVNVGADAPLILACGATNQSVTNIIGSFDAIVEPDAEDADVTIYQRWVSGVSSYGWYFPAQSKVDDKSNASLQVLANEFRVGLVPRHAAKQLNFDAQRSEEYFMKKFAEVYADNTDLNKAVIHLRASALRYAKEVTEEFKAKLLSQIKPILSSPPTDELSSILGWIKTLIGELENAHNVQVSVEGIKSYGDAVEAFIKEPSAIAIQNVYDYLDGILDCGPRAKAFHLAMRYWEGRWVQRLKEIASSKFGNDKLLIRDYCMLAPCVVATFQTAPRLFEVYTGNMEIEFCKTFRFGEADLLIVDEAGQASPEIGSSIFALAKKAIVVGDTYQIEPVWSFGTVEDATVIHQMGINYHKFMEEKGLCVSSGSIMRMAQISSRFSRYSTLQDGKLHGMMLSRHYRCRRSIIEFCNDLVYKGELIPMIADEKVPLFFPFAYVEVSGSASKYNGSWVNYNEAVQIAEWICAKHDIIIAHYTKKDKDPPTIDELVAVVTPFGAQINEVRKAIDTQLMHSGFDSTVRKNFKSITIGTTHSLQGAERQIVLFSAVSTVKEDSNFIDRSSSLLNVAVSRAKDTFVFIGHPDRFIRRKNLDDNMPSSVLSKYIAKCGRRLFPRNLFIVESPTKADAIRKWLGPDYMVAATRGHYKELTSVSLKSGVYRPAWEMKGHGADVLETMNLLKDADALYLGTDDDQEGEKIAWHYLNDLRETLPICGVPVRRLRFHEISHEAIKKSMMNATPSLDNNLVDAAIARELIDYIIGSEYTKFAYKAGISDAPGIGRLKMAIMELVRESTLQRKTEGEYAYRLTCPVVLHGANGSMNATAFLMRKASGGKSASLYWTKEDAKSVVNNCLIEVSTESVITNVKAKQFVMPIASATTAEVLKEAYRRYRLSPDTTMRIMQELYEKDI